MKVSITNTSGVHKVLTLRDNTTLRIFAYKTVEVEREKLTPHILKSKDFIVRNVTNKSVKAETPVDNSTEKEAKTIKSKGGANK